MAFTDKDKEEIRTIVISALKTEMKSIEVDVTESDVMKHAGPVIDAKKAELDGKFELLSKAASEQAEATTRNLHQLVTEGIGAGMKGFEGMLETHFQKVEALLNGVEPEKKAEVAKAVRSALPSVGTGSPALKFLGNYAGPGHAYKPTMLLGGQGSGKTTAAKQFAYGAGFERVVVLEGSRAIEAAALIGRTLPVESGGTIWQDGKVARAYRYAQQGYMTALLIDEYYRILPGDRSPLISALSAFADPKDGIEYYELSTDRVLEVVDGVAMKEEVLRAPRHLLTILATSNIGAAFDVHSGDPAEASRWLTYDMESTSENAKYILGKVLEGKSWDKDVKKAIIAGLVQVLEKGNELKKNHFLELSPDVRILSDAIKLSEQPSQIGRSLINLGLQWVGHTIDGKRNPEQYNKFKELIEGHFTVAKL